MRLQRLYFHCPFNWRADQKDVQIEMEGSERRSFYLPKLPLGFVVILELLRLCVANKQFNIETERLRIRSTL